MKILENYDLKNLNTFGISAQAAFFIEIKNEAELSELLKDPVFLENEKLFLGEGSNVLFTKDFNGIVVLNKIKGIEILEENSTSVLVKAKSGVIWHDLVSFAVDRGYWGIENLALIPGTVGAAPMQNIGAYGAELKNVLEGVEAYDINNGEKKFFNKEECSFGYRDSIFKNSLKNKYFIFSITLALSKIEKKNLNYKILREHLEKNEIEVKSSKDVSDAVSEIRRSKLPDPKVIGNAGSFFKNVFVQEEKLKELLKLYPEMPFFKEDGLSKIPSAWLIEQCGPAKGTSWKGYRVGNVGVHHKQALVLVNHGDANGAEIKELALQIIISVKEKFDLELVPEVNLI